MTTELSAARSASKHSAGSSATRAPVSPFASRRTSRACLGSLAPLLLDDQEQVLLARERQFEAVDAEARVASAEAVLLVLPVFLDDPHWHGEDLEDRRLRIRLARDISEEILRGSLRRGVDVGGAAGVVEATVRHEIWMLRQESAVSRER